MKILLFSRQVAEYSGGRYYDYQLAVNLARLGHQVKIIGLQQPPYLEDFAGYGVNDKIEWEARHPVWTSEGGYDLAIGSQFAEVMLAHRYSQLHDVPAVGIIYEVPSWLQKYFPEEGTAYERIFSDERVGEALKELAHVLVLSETAKKELVDWAKIEPEKIAVVNPAVNHLALPNGEYMRTEPPVASYLGRFHKRKQYGEMVHHLAVEGWDAPIHLIGTGEGESRPSVLSGIELRWHVGPSDATKFRLIQESSVVLIPSRFEGYGIVPGEAVSCGRPCLVFDLPVLREVYGDLIFYASDWEGFAKRARSLVDWRPNAEWGFAAQLWLTDHDMDAQMERLRELPWLN